MDANAAIVEDNPLEVALSTLDEERVSRLDADSDVPEISAVPEMAAEADIDEIPVIAAAKPEPPDVSTTDLAREELASEIDEVEPSEMAIPPVSETLTADIARLRGIEFVVTTFVDPAQSPARNPVQQMS